MSEKDISEEFFNNGYVVFENYIDSDSIRTIKNHVHEMQPKIFDTFSKTPLARGWGNLVNDELLTKIIGLDYLISTAQDITKDSMSCNLLVVNNKPRWVGRDFEFHQEVFNSSTFAAGADASTVRDKWVQIYLALDDEQSLNGGLCIFEGSHKFGLLDKSRQI